MNLALSLRQKLWSGFGLAVLVTALLGGIGYREMTRQIEDFSEIMTEDYGFLNVSGRIYEGMLQCRRHEKDYFLNLGDAKAQTHYLGQFEAQSQQLKELIARLEAMVRQDPDPQLDPVRQGLSNLPADFQGYVQGFRQVVEALSRDPQASPQLANRLMTPHKDLIHQVEEVCTQASQAGRAMFEDKVRQSLEASRRAKVWVLALVLVGVALEALIGLAIPPGIIKPVRAAGQAIRHMAQGDFTHRLERGLRRGGDEIGQMLDDLEAMGASLADTVRQVRQAADSVALAAGEISQGNMDLSQRTQAEAGAVEQTAAAMEEINSQVRNNADNANTANLQAQKTASLAKEGESAVIGTEEAMRAVMDSSRKIEEITTLVNEIAFQTNLLALNASVEAARAGTAGKGFAVVAGEVRTLAGRAAAAAKQIQELVTDGVDKANNGYRLVNESGKTFGQILQGITKVAEITQQINQASREQAEGARQVSQAISQVDQSVQQNAALVEQAAAAAESMSGAASDLRDRMQQFRVD